MTDFFNLDTTTGTMLINGLNDHLSNLSSYYAGQSDPRNENDSIRLWFDTTRITKDIKGTQTQVQTLKFYGNDGWKDLFYIPVGTENKVYVPGADIQLTDLYTSTSSYIGASAKALNNLYNNRSDSISHHSSTIFATSRAVRDLYNRRTHSYLNNSTSMFASGSALFKLYNNRSDSYESTSTTKLATSKAIFDVWSKRSSDTLTNSHDRLATTASAYAVLQRAQQSPIGVRNEDNIIPSTVTTAASLRGVELDLKEGVVVLHRSYFNSVSGGGRD